MKRPLAIALFEIFLIIAAVHAAIYALQFLERIPPFLGPLGPLGIGPAAWGMIDLGFILAMAMVWIPAPKGWIYPLLASIAALGLLLVMLVSGSAFRTLLSALIIYTLTSVYCLLPGTRKLFK